MYIHGVNDIRQTEIHTAEPLVPEPRASEDKMAIEKLKRHKSQETDQIQAEYIYSLLMFVVNNTNLFLDNAELYTIKTRNSYNLHPPLSHLSNTKKEYIMWV